MCLVVDFVSFWGLFFLFVLISGFWNCKLCKRKWGCDSVISKFMKILKSQLNKMWICVLQEDVTTLAPVTLLTGVPVTNYYFLSATFFALYIWDCLEKYNNAVVLYCISKEEWLAISHFQKKCVCGASVSSVINLLWSEKQLLHAVTLHSWLCFWLITFKSN